MPDQVSGVGQIICPSNIWINLPYWAKEICKIICHCYKHKMVKQIFGILNLRKWNKRFGNLYSVV